MGICALKSQSCDTAGKSRDPIEVHPAVADALAAGRPVVALETTIVTHGMPYPQNLELVR